MKWNQLFSHNTRRQEGTADSLLRLLAPSLLGMAVCVLTLCSLTWAWFNMAVGSSITGIQSSEVEVCLVTKTTEGESVEWTASEQLVANGKAVSVTLESQIYFIARGTAANAYLQIDDKYYGPLDLKQGPDEHGNYPVYSITLSDASPVSVSLRWGTVESDSISNASIESVGTMLWPDGSNSFSLILPDNEDEEPNTTPVIDPSADDPQPQPETPANGDTGDNTSDANNDDAQTPDGSTTGDANKEPDATGGNTSDTGDTGTTGDGSTSGSTDTGGDPDSSTEKGSAEKSDGDTTLDGSVVKAAAD